VHEFRAGARWWLDTRELSRAAESEQSDRFEGDAWDELIAAWVREPTMRYDATGCPLDPFTSDRESVTVIDVLTHCIGKRQDQWTQVDKNRVSRSLIASGFERFKAGPRSAREWRYRRISR